ncbi:MAG: hypothetical protein OHK0029_03360 [Armatimonadaceae bacterium]
MTPIYQLVDSLPADNITVRSLKALDFVAPGQWHNVIGFENMIKHVTGETDPNIMYQIRNRAIELYNDPKQGYQRALWIYQTVDNTDKTLGMAAMANKVGEKVGFLSFLNRITPKADTTQTIDLTVKLVAELVAFCNVNGIPGDSIGDFVAALGAYESENLIRMAALVSFDGLIPLGPDFLNRALNQFGSMGPDQMAQNPTFQRLSSVIPGGNAAGQFGFIGQTFQSVQTWMSGFVQEKGLNPTVVVNNLRNYMDVADDKLDYLAGFLDLSTNYYEHTGIQSLSRSLISRAVGEI